MADVDVLLPLAKIVELLDASCGRIGVALRVVKRGGKTECCGEETAEEKTEYEVTHGVILLHTVEIARWPCCRDQRHDIGSGLEETGRGVATDTSRRSRADRSRCTSSCCCPPRHLYVAQCLGEDLPHKAGNRVALLPLRIQLRFCFVRNRNHDLLHRRSPFA